MLRVGGGTAATGVSRTEPGVRSEAAHARDKWKKSLYGVSVPSMVTL